MCTNMSYSNIECNAKLQFKISRFEPWPKLNRANLNAYIAIMICQTPLKHNTVFKNYI